MPRMDVQKVSALMDTGRFTPEKYPELQCTATSKRTGQRCRRCRRAGWSTCKFHGAGGRDPKDRQRPLEASGPQNELNRQIKRARRAVRAAAENVPEAVQRVFRSEYASRVAGPDHDRFLLALAARMEGSMGVREWRRQQEAFGLLKQADG